MKLFKNILTTAITWAALATFATAQVVTGSYPAVFVNGTIIDATQVNADFNYVAAQVNANGAKNGSNSDITALTALATPIPAVAGGSTEYIGTTVGGTANAITITATVPAVSSYALSLGYSVTFKVAAANTGATTLAVGGTAATSIFKQSVTGPSALTGAELVAGQVVTVYYDGTQYQLAQDMTIGYGFGPINNIVAAATTDLGTKATRYVHITGGGTISSFGSSASTTRPFYIINVTASTTLTGSASIVLPAGVASLTLGTGDYALLEYTGTGAWTVISVWAANPRYAATLANVLYVTNNTVTPNTKIDITAAEVIMDSSSGTNYYVDSYGSCTIDFSVVGANGLDAGVIAVNTNYYLYVISTGATQGCLASTSATAPTMPASYVFKTRVGAIHSNILAATLPSFTQRGNHTRSLLDFPTATTGAVGTCSTAPTFVATSTVYGTLTPATATGVDVRVYDSSTGGSQVCVTASNSTSDAACIGAYSSAVASIKTLHAYFVRGGAATLYSCSGSAAANVSVIGWTDAVNAN
jgi:hypothetical protein